MEQELPDTIKKMGNVFYRCTPNQKKKNRHLNRLKTDFHDDFETRIQNWLVEFYLRGLLPGIIFLYGSANLLGLSSAILQAAKRTNGIIQISVERNVQL